MLSILAGMMIAIGGVIYLSQGGVVGALLFSMGLLTILSFKLELFTGKAGLLATNEVTIGKLIKIWFGNFFGTALITFGIILTPRGAKLANKAIPIVELRVANGLLTIPLLQFDRCH